MKVLVVDDHALVRRGMGHVIRECFSDAEVSKPGARPRRSTSCPPARSTSRWSTCACPTPTASSCCTTVKSRWPDLPVIMLTSFDHAQYVRRALAEGAAGYMLKDATPEDLEQAINVALSGGGNVLSPKVIQNLFESIEGGVAGDGTPSRPHGRIAHASARPTSSRSWPRAGATETSRARCSCRRRP